MSLICLPAPLNTFPGLDKCRFARLDAQAAIAEFLSNSFGPLSRAMEVTPLLGTTDAVLLRCLALAAHRPLCRVSWDAQCTQVPSEFPSPFSQRRLANVEAFPLLTHGLDDHVHVWMGFIRVQRHRVAVFEGEFLPREALHRS
jgi:hypothetical protein